MNSTNEDKKLSEDVLFAITNFATAVESACVDLKRHIGDIVGVTKTEASPKSRPYSFDKLKWTERRGTKGPYEQTTKSTCGHTELFSVLQRLLKERNNFFQDREYKYWVHSGDVEVIDRRAKANTNPHARIDRNLKNIRDAGQKLTNFPTEQKG